MPVPIHRLPISPRTLQSSLTQLDLDPSPVSQRRSTTFKPSTPGVWARVNPLWTSWPLRLTKEEVLEMGVDVDAGEQVSVVDVLKRWDPVDGVQGEVNRVGADDLAGVGSEDRRRTSKHRLNLTAHLLGVVPSTLETELPELDAGDALTISSGAPESSSEGKAARDQLVDVLSGRHVIMHDGYGPWSTRYCGHQFGVWAGQLGDGRAISILETTSDKGGRQEIQLKGAGRTPFSRHADGLAVLRSGVREYLGCEAVAALGIPTTRSLALLTAEDLPVIRETGPEPSSLTARIAPSFIRIGHFQALNPGEEGRRTRQIFLGGGYMTQDADREGPMGGQGSLKGLRELAGWCIGIMDELRVKEGRGEGKGGVGKEGEGDVGREEQKGELGVRGVRAFFEEVVRRNAEMVAGWQVYGFCHGVINTDNVSIFGLTIDYGPYAFMDVFDENHICNHSDPSGLYSYANQPSRILFALDKLQQSLAPLIGYEAVLSSRSRGNQGPDLAGVSLDDENLSAETVQELTDVGMDEMNGWEERYWRMEREAEARGWEKRFGLATSQNTDKREITQTFLRHLHAHGLDMSSAFRSLAHFDPIQATSSSNAEYIQGFIRDFIARTTPTSKPSSAGAGDTDSSELARETKSAEDAWTAWFSQYATRATEQAEQAAWAVAADASKVGEWNENRKQSILAANPRFVLRQWVLEELIKDMDEALGQGDEAGRREARKRLSGVLQMATRPFEPYGEDLPQNPESCPTPEAAEEQRLCGLGAKDMLGFQCSCSS